MHGLELALIWTLVTTGTLGAKDARRSDMVAAADGSVARLQTNQRFHLLESCCKQACE